MWIGEAATAHAAPMPSHGPDAARPIMKATATAASPASANGNLVRTSFGSSRVVARITA